MIVSDAITLLKGAELKQLGIKADKPTVIGYINLAVLEIHKRFNLWEAEAIITMAADVLLYKLDGTDPNVTIDLSDNDLLMIDSVWDYTGEQLVLNDEEDPWSVSTPKYHQVEVVQSVANQDMGVIYRASPKFLTHEKQEIPIPPQFLEAMFAYVGYKGTGSVKADTKGSNNTHYVRFEAACNLIDEKGLIAQDDLTSKKFENNIYP